MHQLFLEQVALHPQRPAVECDGQVWTYAELQQLAQRHAAALARLGAPAGCLVALAMERGADLVAAVLGVQMAGAVCLPFDAAAPAARIAALCEDAQPFACIGDAAADSALRAGLPVDVHWLASTPDAEPQAWAGNTHGELAYCIYTSGSTGKPKGVLVPQSGIGNLAQAQAASFGLSSTDRVAQFASPAFDAFMFELVMALAQGAALVIVPPESRHDPALLLDFLCRSRISVVTLPTVMAAALAQLPPQPECALRAVISAGDVLPRAAARGWRHAAPLFNAYGPTEATIWSTLHRCVSAGTGESEPIGLPIQGCRIYLLDETGQTVADGVVGEIHIGGAGVAQGYLRRPELSRAAFLADPFAGGAARMYRSGDLGRRLADGTLEFMGRVDQQIKLRGYRIEPGEIEAALRSHGAVADAVVLPRTLAQGDKQLVAHVVARSGAEAEAGVLRRYLAQLLPAYMVPALFDFLPVLPFNVSGKVDRHQLAARTLQGDSQEADAVPAGMSAEEGVIAAIWSETLGVQAPGVNDSFYASGGHSLAAVQIANRINLAFGIQLGGSDVLLASSIGALARRVVDSAAHQPLPAASAPAQTWLPASLAQSQVAFVNELSGRPEAYLARASISFDGELDIAALEHALQLMVERHDIFRSRFELREGRLMQAVETEWQVKLELLDCSADDDGGAAATQRALETMCGEVLDPAALPLVSWRLLRLGAQRHVLLHVEHHYVHDGWSYRLFLRELAQLYSQIVDKRPVGLGQDAVQFASYCLWQQEWLQSPQAAAMEAQWLALLDGAPAPAPLAALTRADGGAPDAGGALMRLQVPAALVAALHARARELQLTVFQLMFGSFGLLLSRLAGSEDIVLGTSSANRNRREWEQLIGMIVNLVPVRLRARPEQGIDGFLRESQQALLQALAGAELPFARIVEVVQPEPGLGQPLAQVFFSFHSALTADVEFSGLRIEVAEALANRLAKFPLGVTVIPAGADSAWNALFEYDGAIYDGAAVEALAAGYLALLEAVAKEPRRALSEADAFLPRRPAQEDCLPFGQALGAMSTQRLRVELAPALAQALRQAAALHGTELGTLGALACYLALERAGGANPEFDICLPDGVHAWSGAVEAQPLTALLCQGVTAPRTMRACRVPVAFAHGLAQQDLPFAAYGLLLALGEEDENLVLTVQAPAPAQRIGRFMERALEQLAQALETAPHGALAELDTLPPEERAQLEAWNASAAAYPLERGVHRLFEDQVARTPDATAVVYLDQTLSYTQLNARANRLARHLRTLGVGPNVLAGICVERSLEMVVGILAILKAGGAYVPLDPAYPAERLGHMLRDAQLPVLLTQQGVLARLPQLAQQDSQVLCLDREDGWLDACDSANLEGGSGADDLAYAIYTSGSTGRPKGTLIHQRGLCNLVNWYIAQFGLGAQDRALLFSSFSFDLTQKNLFAPLLVGGQLHIPLEGYAPDQAPAYIARHGITFINCAPSAFYPLLDYGLREQGGTLRHVFLGGEPINAALLHGALGGMALQVHNTYGPTEASDVVAYYSWNPAEALDSLPIGRPVANVRLYVLDGAGRLAPAGVAGEICVGGVGVGRGYLGRPEQTAERFGSDPYAPAEGGRLYRTGDIGRWRDDGQLEFIGRRDFQVKLRGFRIELGEIEARLAEHPAVREAVAVVRQDEAGEQLVAYYVCRGGAHVWAAELAAHLATHLPEFMVPAFYVGLEALPLSPNGKLDRRALPVPDSAVLEAEEDVASGDHIMAGLRAAMQALMPGLVFHSERSFFSMGLYSLALLRLTAKCREQFQIELGVTELLRCKTPRALHGLLRQRLEQGASTAAAIQPVPRVDGMLLSSAQQRLWFMAQMDGAGSAYHIPLGLWLDGELNEAALRAALDAIVARHEALRARFVQEGEQVLQRFADSGCGFALLDMDLSARPADEAKEEALRLAAEEAAVPFDLENGPLLRGRLLRLAPRRHLLLITQHHIVSDGWSKGIFMRELSALYQAFAAGGANPLAPLALQYADYAVWQRSQGNSSELASQAAYWQATLAGAPTLLEMPADRPRPARQDYAGAFLPYRLTPELTARLQALSESLGVSLFTVILASWALLLGRLAVQNEVVIGTPSANRGQGGTEKLIGFFANTLALRLDLGGEPSVAELLQRVRQQVQAAQEHQDLPFDQVVDLLRPERSLAYSPLFQAMLVWQSAGEDGMPELPGIEVAAQRSAQRTAKFDLTLAMGERNGALEGGLEYASALFDEASAAQYLEHWHCLLQAMTETPQLEVGRLAWMTAAQQAQVLVDCNRTAAEYPRDTALHRLFEARVAAAPHATALLHEGGEQLSYEELNQRANRLARHLRRRGVEPGQRVAVQLGRSFELVAAQLAILKCGAAYVPLDPAFPPSRLQWMAQDCAVRWVLTVGALPVLEWEGLARIDMDASEIAGEDAANLDLASDAAVAAYVMYTSGSSGQPKGVLVPHRAVSRLVLNSGYAGFSSADRVAFASNPAFDAATMEVWAPLLNGGCAVIIGQDTLLDPARLAQALRRQEVSVLWLTVGLFNQYAQQLQPELARLRCLIVGGDALDPQIMGRLLQAGAPPLLLNGYGPTETTTFALTHAIGARDCAGSSIPLGRPIGNTRVYVLDALGQPVPFGVRGEIHIGGDGVALGYLNQPELTAQRFLPDPYAGQADARMYRSGDMGRRRRDGSIEFLGREDGQLKLRGFRIEIGEIEAALAACDGVREAAVLVLGEGAARQLCAYYVAAGQGVDAAALRAALAQRLPAYMLPAAYVALEHMPLTANGKLDRLALPAPQHDSGAGQEQPQGEMECLLAAIWGELLQLPRVGRQDNFFMLGGHSLLAIQLSSRLREALELDVGLTEIFAHPVLSGLADRLVQAQLAQFDLDELQALAGGLAA
ncbi:non-ribosomal peptide synthetase [Massilia sp. NR 4-1]|uniref:non-ribosomal peptide synthetase n=1 Tax=Massilia sp. NR 4-1 TaxID=1678028 RepID=UPI001CBD2C28|nr:non-ribosomal peptide synthetase [Massilia sp. NR 4-1]